MHALPKFCFRRIDASRCIGFHRRRLKRRCCWLMLTTDVRLIPHGRDECTGLPFGPGNPDLEPDAEYNR